MKILLIFIATYIGVIFGQYSYDARLALYRNPYSLIFRQQTADTSRHLRSISCTKNAQFTTMIDGKTVTVECNSSGANAVSRCTGCCQAYALAKGKTKETNAGFIGNDGKCVCCGLN